MNTLSATIDRYVGRHEKKLFWIIMIGYLGFLGTLQAYFYHPQGFHFIRQTEGMAFTQYYVLTDTPLFEPGVLRFESLDGKTAAEFPLFYWLSAQLIEAGGPFFFSCLIWNMLLLYLGLYHLFRILRLFNAPTIGALLFVLLMLSSPMWLFYAATSMPDTTALALFFIAVYQILAKREQMTWWRMLWFSGLFGLVFMLKPTFALYLPGLLLGVLAFKEGAPIIPNKRFAWIWGVPVVSAVGIAVAWWTYVKSYNEKMNSTLFLTSTQPYWDTVQERKAVVWDFIQNMWFAAYHHPNLLKGTLFALLIGFLFWRRSHPALLRFILCSLAGGLAFFLLFFSQFQDHDYYMIVLLPVYIALWGNAIYVLHALGLKYVKPSMSKWVIPLMYIIGLAILPKIAGDTKNHLGWRYSLKNDYQASISSALDGIGRQMHWHDIPRDARVICFGDKTNNASLVFLGRRGWVMDEISTDEELLMMRNGGATHVLLPADLDLPQVFMEGHNILFSHNGYRFIRLADDASES